MPQSPDSTRLSRQFLMFTLVGAAGFGVDAGVLQAMIVYGNHGLYVSRLVSYLSAATFTWAANRHFTFPGAKRDGHARQWLRFVLANLIGGLTNLGTYAWLVAHVPFVHQHPVLGVAAGSLAGLVINFSLSRALVFRH